MIKDRLVPFFDYFRDGIFGTVIVALRVHKNLKEFSDLLARPAKRLVLAIAKCIMTLPETEKFFNSALQPQ